MRAAISRCSRKTHNHIFLVACRLRALFLVREAAEPPGQESEGGSNVTAGSHGLVPKATSADAKPLACYCLSPASHALQQLRCLSALAMWRTQCKCIRQQFLHSRNGKWKWIRRPFRKIRNFKGVWKDFRNTQGHLKETGRKIRIVKKYTYI